MFEQMHKWFSAVQGDHEEELPKDTDYSSIDQYARCAPRREITGAGPGPPRR